jgi:hypothetical protein
MGKLFRADRSGISRRQFLVDAGAAAAYAVTSRPGRAGEVTDRGVVASRVDIVRVEAGPGQFTNSFIPHRALGNSIDILHSSASQSSTCCPHGSVDELYDETTIKKCLSAGWGAMTYRQNTELQMAAWHWNHNGKWSDAANKQGYFTGSSEPTDFLRHSYGYPLPHRGNTRNGGSTHGFSRLTDGNPKSYWKSNPYLTSRFTGEDDSMHPQWVVIDLEKAESINAVRIAWANPYATQYEVQYWTGRDAMDEPTAGAWNTFPQGIVEEGRGSIVTLKLATEPVEARFLRVLMTRSSNTPDTHGADDPRNAAGYAIHEVYAGTLNSAGDFNDLITHSPDQNQTPTYCSSIDPWHAESELDLNVGDQTGFDLFFTSGVTNGVPAFVPIAMLYGTPEDAAAEIAYLYRRKYPVAYVEMGEEPDGQYVLPEDYGALYLQFADAIHRLVPESKLGGPVFQGVNEDIKVWPDAEGRTSWLGRFLDYLKVRGRMSDLAFMSFEHYPFDPCMVTWSDLYREPELVTHILDVWREDGLPEDIPKFITESNLSWGVNQSFVEIFGALWLADYAGAFLTAGGDGLYYYQFFPWPLFSGCHGWGTFGMFTASSDFKIQQYTSQYFAARLINLEWVKPGDELHRLYRASCDAMDASGHRLVTAYAVERPDGMWGLMLVNRDLENAHKVRVVFRDASLGRNGFFSGPVAMTTFGQEQYEWHEDGPNGHPEPDGPSVTQTVLGGREALFDLPRASIAVLRGRTEGLAFHR